ncbi:ABC transporter permease [Bacilliculturomica massiliensis]|uniref:ABC transporter permease n=1 Tax=Bacilliculturomica massiliensis TaxID=1917867 RepID=UPI001FE2F152|nr:ABC transporter permease [Bacilliculturomica massiliensis]
MFMSFTAVVGSVELGLIYAILALGVFLSFRTLNTPDLTVDGSIVTGSAVSAVVCSTLGSPVLGLLLSFVAGGLAGAVTALLNTKLKIEALLAGILVMLGLYSVNLRILGGRANIPLTQSPTIYKNARSVLNTPYSGCLIGIGVLILVIILFYLFLNTRLGFALRATGDNEYMVRSAGVDSSAMRLLGISLSNAFVGLAGGMLAQYQSTADINMGTGMVVIGLASVIIGEAVFGVIFRNMPLLLRLFAVAAGAVLYRLVLAVALNSGMPSTDLKLTSAVIVTIALASGAVSDMLPGRKKKKTILGQGDVSVRGSSSVPSSRRNPARSSSAGENSGKDGE